MLSIKEILELSNSMCVEITDNVDNKHYIINECGQSVEFDLDVLMNTNKERNDEFKELKRLAKIGRAVEQATKTGTAWIYIESINECTYPSNEEIQLLLEWAEIEE